MKITKTESYKYFMQFINNEDCVNGDDDLGMLRALASDAEKKYLESKHDVDYQIAMALSNQYICEVNKLRMKEKVAASKQSLK